MPELAGDRLGLEPGRGRGEHDGVSHPLVRLDDRPGLRPDGAGDLLHEEPLAQLLHLVLEVPAQRADARGRRRASGRRPASRRRR